MQAYQRAIEKAVQRLKEDDGEVHVLDLGCGAGLFAMMAAKAGATSIVACDMHEPLCVATRKVKQIPLTAISAVLALLRGLQTTQELAVLFMFTRHYTTPIAAGDRVSMTPARRDCRCR